MKKTTLLKTLLMAAGLLIESANAWATIDLPSGYEITKAYIGTLSAGVVTPEDFEDYSIGDEWSIVTNKSGDNVKATSTLSITSVEEVEKPAIGTSGGYLDAAIIPTYVSGKTLTGTISNPGRNTSTYTQHRFTYDLGETLTDGYLVFSADLFNAGDEKTTPERIFFLDASGNEVLQFYFKGGSNQQLFQIAENGVARGWSGNQSQTRTDTGFGIKDLTINIAEGTGTFSLDYIHITGSGRYRDFQTTTVSFGTGHNIRYVAFAREEYSSSGAKTELTYLDNVELYRLEPSASAHTWTVYADCGGSMVQLATGQAEKDAKYTATGLPKVVEYNSKFYVLDDATVTDYCTQEYTMGDDDENQTITYTVDDDIVYFNDLTSASATGQSTTASGGSYGAWNNIQTISGLAAGTYTITIKTVSKYGSSWRGEVFAINGTEVARNAPGEAGVASVEVNVPDASTAITFWPTYNYTDNMDYILIKWKSNLPSTENIVVTPAGYATYVSNYNLDFSDPALKVKAYTVEVASKGVATLHAINKVPAKTPVLLYVAGGNGEGENIAVTTDAVVAVTGNDLVAGRDAAVATDGGTVDDVAYTNMILNNVDSKIGFYFAAGQTVAKNRAYLHIDSDLAPDAVGGVSPSRMVMVFADDETTGIQNLTPALSEGEGVVYNLRGQRVAQPTKGLYIVNGKKVVIK